MRHKDGSVTCTPEEEARVRAEMEPLLELAKPLEEEWERIKEKSREEDEQAIDALPASVSVYEWDSEPPDKPEGLAELRESISELHCLLPRGPWTGMERLIHEDLAPGIQGWVDREDPVFKAVEGT